MSHTHYQDLLGDDRWPPENGTQPDWWPDGADPVLTYQCYAANGCEGCQAVLDALEQHWEGVAIDGENASLKAFAEAGGGGIGGP